MKRKSIFKMILLIITVIMLLSIPLNTFATDITDLNDFGNWEDGGNSSDLTSGTTSTDTNTNTSTNVDTNITDTNTPTTTEENKTLPNAGLAEDTTMVISIIILGIIAVLAYRKINEYKNI